MALGQAPPRPSEGITPTTGKSNRASPGSSNARTPSVYSTGYSANSGTLQTVLKKEDLAILDMAVHASVYEGCQLTNVKTFPHNHMDALERVLRLSKDKYRTRMVVIDGVYSQDGDLAPVDRILELCRRFGAYLMVDDAHGTGVIGRTGRGVLELHDLFHEVDFITGTFSKTFAH